MQDAGEVSGGALINLVAEQAVLGALLYHGAEAHALVQDTLRTEHFAEPLHSRLFDAVAAQIAANRAVEVGLVAPKFSSDPAFHELGGVRYLMDLIDHAPAVTSIHDFANELAQLHTRRALVLLTQDVAAAARDPAVEIGSLLREIDRTIDALAEGQAPASRNLVDAQTAALEAVEQMDHEAAHGKPRGLLTGLRCFDYRLRGLQPGWLVILGGRPSMGKTALARSAAMAAAARNRDQLVVYFALEMDRKELSDRSLSELSFLGRGRDADPIPYFEMGGKLPLEDRDRLRRLIDHVPSNLLIEDSAVLSLEHIRRRLYALKRRGRLGAVFVDYLQIMERPLAKGRNDALVIQEITSGLKRLARELRVCIVLLSQLSRGVEGRDDKRPQLSDLRESGAIEQDANAVLFAYREAYYLQRSQPKDLGKLRAWETECEIVRRDLDVITAKVRAGPVGTDRQAYFAEYDHVADRAEAA